MATTVKTLHEIKGFEILAESKETAQNVAVSLYELTEEMQSNEITGLVDIIKNHKDKVNMLRGWINDPKTIPMPIRVALKAMGVTF